MFFSFSSVDPSCLCSHEYICSCKKNAFFRQLRVIGKIKLDGPYMYASKLYPHLRRSSSYVRCT